MNSNQKYKIKYINLKKNILMGGVGDENPIVLSKDNLYDIIKNLSLDDKLVFFNLIVRSPSSFSNYINEPYFNMNELETLNYNCNAYVQNRCFSLLRFAREKVPPCPFNIKTCLIAVQTGQIDMVRWLLRQNPPCPIGFPTELCEEAAKNGDLEMLILLRTEYECPWDTMTCNLAAKHGHLNIIKWARNQNPPCPWSRSTCHYAAKNGHLHVLEWVRSQDPPCDWNEETCALAGENGHLDVLKWLRSQEPPCPWNETLCQKAAENGQFYIIQMALDSKPPCPCDGTSFINAAQNEHLQIMRYINYKCRSSLKFNALDLIVLSMDLGSRGDLRILEWLHRYKFQLNLEIVRQYARLNNHMNVIEWLNTL